MDEEITWTEEAEAAFEIGREDVLKAGVWVVVSWVDGKDLEYHVFENRAEAEALALKFANYLWNIYLEEDWPAKPEIWKEVFDFILDNTASFDVLECEHKEIQQ